MKYKIGVFGSAAGDMDKALPLAVKIGEVLGEHKDSVIIVTGACAGLPYAAAETAAKLGVEVWGYSSSQNVEALQLEYPDHDTNIYTKIIYVPKEFPLVKIDRSNKKYRNVISTGNCDAGIIISGRWGTMNEFTNLVDQQKLVGVLTGSGGIADELLDLSKKITKEGQGQIIFENDPTLLVEKILQRLHA